MCLPSLDGTQGKNNMSKLNEMRFGEPDTVAEILDTECEEHELRAALTNALERIASLETAVQRLQKNLDD